jgi:hypothetical protein
MSSKPRRRNRSTWRKLVLTAALTAFVTSIVTEWLPKLVERLFRDPYVLVEVHRDNQPVSGVNITLENPRKASERVIGTGLTDEKGTITVTLPSVAEPPIIFIHGSFREADVERRYEKSHSFEKYPAQVHLDVKDFRSLQISQPVVSAPEKAQPSTNKIVYADQPLQADRRVQAILEIDWLVGTPRPELKVSTPEGELGLRSLLAEVGIDLEVAWSDELPRSVMGNDNRFSDEELISVMESNRDAALGDKWHFYIVLGGEHSSGPVYDLLFDPELRRGGAVFDLAMNNLQSGEVLFSVIHTMGHMMNLPHPWQAYGDTKSVMTYPFRWGEKFPLSSSDFYRFDSVARRHMARSPAQYVKPGGSRFLEYGKQQPWVVEHVQGE